VRSDRTYTDSELLALVEERLVPVAASLSADDLEFMEQMLARPLVTGAPLATATRERIQRLLRGSAPLDTGA
jgi:hypothetical protein